MFKPSKPCPFCASENLSVELLQGIGHNEYAVMCKNCGSFGPNDLGQSGAVEMWDLRRVPAVQQERVPDVAKPRRRMVACPECETMFGVELS